MQAVIGIDIGGTKMDIARVERGELYDQQRVEFDATGTEQEILNLLISSIEKCMTKNVYAIGIGVPGIVDIEQGIVYNLTNVASWKHVSLKKIIQEKFKTRVDINNDANCFVLGEKYYGCAVQYRNIIGVSLGTGLGVGLIFDDKLYTGSNCGAGEFGQISYLQHDYESYCSGKFFRKYYSEHGSSLYHKASAGDDDAKKAFGIFGHHLGMAISSMLLAYDPQCIVLGGSIARAYPFFQEMITSVLKEFPYQNVINDLIIKQSTTQSIAVFGAASLCLDKHVFPQKKSQTVNAV